MKMIRLYNPMLPGSLPVLQFVNDYSAAALLAAGVVNPADITDGRAALGATAVSFVAAAGAGTIVDQLVDPFAGLGLGVTTFVEVASAAQLALGGSQIVVGAAAAAAGTTYAIKIRAVSGDGSTEIAVTLTYTAIGVAPPAGNAPGSLILDGSDPNDAVAFL